jgi:hypothetical protein
MKTLFWLPALLLAALSTQAQLDTNAVKPYIRSCADSLSASFKTGDWHKLARFTNPALIAMVGGEKSFVEMVDKQMKLIGQDAIRESKTGRILQVVKTPNGWQCVTEQVLDMEMLNKPVHQATYLIGTSQDGKHWYFLDANANAGLSAAFIPDLDKQLVVPGKVNGE